MEIANKEPIESQYFRDIMKISKEMIKKIAKNNQHELQSMCEKAIDDVPHLLPAPANFNHDNHAKKLIRVIEDCRGQTKKTANKRKS